MAPPVRWTPRGPARQRRRQEAPHLPLTCSTLCPQQEPHSSWPFLLSARIPPRQAQRQDGPTGLCSWFNDFVAEMTGIDFLSYFSLSSRKPVLSDVASWQGWSRAWLVRGLVRGAGAASPTKLHSLASLLQGPPIYTSSNTQNSNRIHFPFLSCAFPLSFPNPSRPFPCGYLHLSPLSPIFRLEALPGSGQAGLQDRGQEPPRYKSQHTNLADGGRLLQGRSPVGQSSKVWKVEGNSMSPKHQRAE